MAHADGTQVPGSGRTEEDSREERGPKVPALALEPTLRLLRMMQEGVGFGRVARENVASALGYSSLNGRSNRAIASMIHYGLVDRTGNSAVEISGLGKQLLLPRDQGELARAMSVAALRPALFKKLFARFEGHALPAFLPNILVREFGVLLSSSEDVAKVFRETAADAGLLRNGVLYSSPELTESDTQQGVSFGENHRIEKPEETTSEQTFGDSQPNSVAGVRRYTVPLDRSGQRVADIALPFPHVSADLRRITKWAEYMLELEKDELDG